MQPIQLTSSAQTILKNQMQLASQQRGNPNLIIIYNKG
jgi:hypothetical protein